MNNEIKNWKNEIAAGLAAGIAVGVATIIVALSISIMWQFQKSLTHATIAIAAMFSVLYYRSWRLAIYKNFAFTAGLFIAAGFMGCVFGSFVKIIALVGIGLSTGFMIKIILGLKKKERVTQ